jgi:hypothetical protein
MDDDERAAIRAEGHDPDHPTVLHALGQAKRSLHLDLHRKRPRRPPPASLNGLTSVFDSRTFVLLICLSPNAPIN